MEYKIAAGQDLSARWFMLELPQLLNPKEKKFLQKAVEELIEEEIVEFVEKGKMQTLKLTQQGENDIY